jgi:hypothetical protein
MSLELNINMNRQSRCCSFCRRPGHNITRCNDQQILIFERETLNVIRSLTQENSQIDLFRNYMLNYALHAPNVVKAFAIRNCGANARSNMSNCMELIIQYFISQTQNEETNNQTIQELNPEEQSNNLNFRRERRFGFSELSLPYYEMDRRTIDEDESIIYAMMFIRMIRAINESVTLNRKFDIKITISEKQDDLHEKNECIICYDEHKKQDFIKLNCGHEFCKDCIKQSLQNEKKITPCCALCRTNIINFEIKHESIKNDLINYTGRKEK